MGTPETRHHAEDHYRDHSGKSQGSITEEKNAITCSLYEAKAPAVWKLSKEKIAAHKQELNNVCHLRPILPPSDISYVQTQYGEALLGSVLYYQLARSMDTFRKQVLHAKERGERLKQAAEKKQEFFSKENQPSESSPLWCEETIKKY